jgi:hypothetical protein
MKAAAAAVLVLAALSGVALADEAKTGQPVILSPTDGAIVSNPVTVEFKMSEPETANMAGAAHGAHLHLVIDAPLPGEGSRIPMDQRHHHLMHGETATTLTLPPGRHTVQLIEGSMGHTVPAGAAHSELVTFEVK